MTNPVPTFYVGTHPDDALLFHGDQLYTDLHTAGVQVHSIVPDAGDSGRTDGWWQAREAAHVAAINATFDVRTVEKSTVDVNGHPITQYRGSSFDISFMRLPDGNLDGQGFGHGSLTQLQAGKIATLQTVDGATSYESFADFTDTLRALIKLSSRSGVWVNAADYDRSKNPNDHPDHYAVADALSSFCNSDGLYRAWWVSYSSENLPANLTGGALNNKQQLFSCYGWALHGLMLSDANCPNEQEWSWWGPRSYKRVERA